MLATIRFLQDENMYKNIYLGRVFDKIYVGKNRQEVKKSCHLIYAFSWCQSKIKIDISALKVSGLYQAAHLLIKIKLL